MTWLRSGLVVALVVVALAIVALAGDEPERGSAADPIAQAHGLDALQTAQLRAIFDGSPRIGEGNPAVTRHPMTPEACRERQTAAGMAFHDPAFERICGGPYMAPLYDPARQRPEDATACIDQLEFPDIPCAYPVVWARASEAALICEAMGKRLCDAHEWEGACAGALEPPDYRFDLALSATPSQAVGRMRTAHNDATAQTWSYGDAYRSGVCGTGSSKSEGCDGGSFAGCGSNTYPTGAFPECRSALGVYDLHGNAAEHMNLPLAPDQMASAGSASLGVTEMKGSWFVFGQVRAHEDWCRWRAPYWHGTRVRAEDSHHNYHLGFRCCRTLPAR